MKYFKENLSPEELKKAYRENCKRLHPDKNNGSDAEFLKMQKEYEDIISKGISNEQYELEDIKDLISDPDKREAFLKRTIPIKNPLIKSFVVGGIQELLKNM